MEAELAQRIVSGLRDAGIGFVSYLPETRLSQILPLLREDRVIGALSVSRRAPGPFDPEVVEILRNFATHSSIALQKARLVRAIAEQEKLLEGARQRDS